MKPLRELDRVVENFLGTKEELVLPTLLEMVEQELVKLQKNFPEATITESGARQRERIMRLPNIMPTEISVGQRPSSEDRAQFELWMRNLGLDSDPSISAVNGKLSAITSFFENPGKNLADASMPQTLSYLMFLNQFTYMLKEFNASVAGFLWEPFLATLFGGGSRQVPTSEGDIADIRIDAPGGDKNSPISLKILNKAGDVKGSFRDLVSHFATGGTNMRYVIVTKEQSQKRKIPSKATFWEFDITAENFMEWIGHPEHRETVATKEVVFNLKSAEVKKNQNWIRRGSSKNAKGEGAHLWIKHASTRGKKVAGAKWIRIANHVGAVIQDNAALIALDPMPAALEPGVDYTAQIAVVTSGGKGGVTVSKEYGPMPGAVDSKDLKNLWGGSEGLARFAAMKEQMPANEFFQLVLDEAPGAGGRGAEGGTQFHIKPLHYTNKANAIGTLKITDSKVEEFFELAAKKLNKDLVDMFNYLADLNDNIGRFFLVDCGGGQCTTKDEAKRTSAGASAMQNAVDLKNAVDGAIASETHAGAEQLSLFEKQEN